MENREYVDNENYCARLNEFLDYDTTLNMSENTITGYSKSINDFLLWVKNRKKFHGIGDTQFNKVLREDIREYQKKLQHMKNRKGETFKPATVNTKMSAIYEFFKYLDDNGIIKENPYRKINKIKVPKKIRPSLTAEEATQLLHSIESIRDRAIFSIYVNGGIRREELLHLQVEDYLKTEKFLRIKSGKGDKERVVLLNNVMEITIDDWLIERQEIINTYHLIDNGHLFITRNKGVATPMSISRPNQLVAEYIEKSGLPREKQGIHILRHTFATLMAEQGIEGFVLKDLMGHESIQTTEIYVHNISKPKLQQSNNLINIG